MVKLKEKKCLFINGKEYPLNSTKLLVGSAENCDIVIPDDSNSISHYHSMLFLSNEKLMILDLQSTNGTFVNGSKISEQTPVFEGDTITFGKVHAELSEANTVFEIQDQEKEIQTFDELKAEKQYIPRAASETEVLIDGEYCDILFSDQVSSLSKLPLNTIHIDAQSYIEADSLEEEFEIREETQGECLQITTTIHGNILEQYYFPINDGTIYASPKEKKGMIQLDLISQKIPLLKVSSNTVELCNIDGFTHYQSAMSVSENKVLSMGHGPLQVFVEVASAPNTLLHLSALGREKSFFQDTAKKFAAVILPMLLLLLVDFNPEKKKPVKKLSIIYKKPTKANVDGQKMASSNPNDLKQNTGHKSTKQPDKKIAHSKSGQKAQPKKAPQQKVAKASKPAAKQASKTKAKTKAYNFKMASNISSVFSSSKSVAVVNNNNVSNVKTTSTQSGSLSTKVNGTSSNNIGNMGSDSAGRSLASYGSKGLSSKSGRDTAYIQTETVVLGSMDPELLRKILQQYLPQFRHCYQQELAYNSEDIKGIVDLNFEITGSGKVAKINVRAKDSRFSKRGTNCMANVLAVIDFPKPKGGGRVAVRQPLSFFSEQEKG